MTEPTSPSRPAAATDHALLRDGGHLDVRDHREAERDAVLRLLQRLSPASVERRFLTGGLRLDDRVVGAMTAGHAVVGLVGDELVALASYVPLRDPARAEMAIVVEDAHHGRGIGTVLFERLARDARARGIRRFLAVVSGSNAPMLAMLGRLGFRQTRSVDQGEVEVEVELQPDPHYQQEADSRMHVAAAASLRPMFAPRSVAIVGPSRTRGSIGHGTLRNLLKGGFSGPVYPIHPTAPAVASVRAYSSAKDVGGPVDLAVIVVPAASVMEAARDVLEAGARALVVISAGFAEVGEAGRAKQAELLALCRAHEARLVGPNCMGILVNRPGAAGGAIDATFAPTLPPTGSVAVASQSGALGLAMLDRAAELGIGISSFVSMGNKADVSANDLIECWEDDAATKVVALYLESFGNPRRFARIAQRVGARKPIVAVKGGRSESGRRAAASHTAALAGSEVAVGALFRQAGVIRCDTLEELLDVTALLANQPLPEGNRVGIVTNAGGLGILCADASESHGLAIPELSEESQRELRKILPPEASVKNPVDMIASASAAAYGRALQILLADPGVDAAIVLFIPPLVTQAADVAAALRAACDPPPRKPVLACFMGAQGTPELLRGAVTIPSYSFPEAAGRALGHAAAHAAWLRRPAGRLPAFDDLDTKAMRRIVADALREETSTWLSPGDVAALLGAAGVRYARSQVARSAGEAAAMARGIGGPVAVKLSSRTVLHKSDVGGVHLDVAPEKAADAYDAIERSLAERGLASAFEGAVVQPMISGGVECLVGVVNDPTFGPLVGFGLGGVLAEVMGDVTFRLLPLSDVDADQLIGCTRAAKLLAGARGAPPSDVAALRDLLLRVSALVEEVPELAELDINPVLVAAAGKGLVALDARVRLAPMY